MLGCTVKDVVCDNAITTYCMNNHIIYCILNFLSIFTIATDPKVLQ